MATPHVTGLVATLMEHYSEFRSNPAMLRAHMMATAIAHNDVTGKSFDYGLGKRLGLPRALGAVRRRRVVNDLDLGVA